LQEKPFNCLLTETSERLQMESNRGVWLQDEWEEDCDAYPASPSGWFKWPAVCRLTSEPDEIPLPGFCSQETADMQTVVCMTGDCALFPWVVFIMGWKVAVSNEVPLDRFELLNCRHSSGIPPDVLGCDAYPASPSGWFIRPTDLLPFWKWFGVRFKTLARQDGCTKPSYFGFWSLFDFWLFTVSKWLSRAVSR
jgi:hypothetical protein